MYIKLAAALSSSNTHYESSNGSSLVEMTGDVSVVDEVMITKIGITKRGDIVHTIRPTLAIAMAILLWGYPISRAYAQTPPQQDDNSNAVPYIDPRALKLLEQVKKRLQSIQTLSAVCSDTHRRLKGVSPTNTSVYIRQTQVRLMRPNFTRADTTLLYQKVGEKNWNNVHFRTDASDGVSEWNVNSDHEFTRGKATADGHDLSLYDMAPLNGFFDPDDFVLTKIALFQKEGLLKSIALATTNDNGVSNRLVRLVYQRVGSQVIDTEDYTIGSDLLMHRIRHTSSTGETENTVELTQIRVNAPMTPSSFAYALPAGAQPPRSVPEAVLTSFLPPQGATAPDLTAVNAQGAPIRLSDYRGKWVVLDFWATWCGPCVQSFPSTNALAELYKDKNVVMLAISVGDKTKVFRDWAAKHKEYNEIHFAVDPEGIDGKGVAAKFYHASALPTQFLIDPDGKISASFVGYDGKKDTRLADALKNVLK